MSDSNIIGLAYQRDDMMFDVYIGNKGSLGMFKGVTKKRSERPSIPAFAEGLRLCDAKRLMSSQGCRPRSMKFRFVDDMTRNRFYTKHPELKVSDKGSLAQYIEGDKKNELFCIIGRLKKVSDIITNLPTSEKLSEVSGVHTLNFPDLTGPSEALKKIVVKTLIQLTEVIRHQKEYTNV